MFFTCQAICAIRDGLSDPLVRTGHKLALHHRAVRMKESASCKKYRLQLRDLPTVQVQDVKHVCFSQCQCVGFKMEQLSFLAHLKDAFVCVCVFVCLLLHLTAGDYSRTAVSSRGRHGKV